MGDAFEGLPSWVNYVMAFNGSTVYVETTERGVSGRVVVKGGSTGHIHSFDNPGSTGENHQWWKPDDDVKKTLAIREQKQPEGRTLTEEEAEILQDLGLLDYALTQAGHKLGEEEQETSMVISVHGEDSKKLLYTHTDYIDGERVTDVHGFARVMLRTFKALGFTNRMEIDFPDVWNCPRYSTDDSDF